MRYVNHTSVKLVGGGSGERDLTAAASTTGFRAKRAAFPPGPRVNQLEEPGKSCPSLGEKGNTAVCCRWAVKESTRNGVSHKKATR